MTTLNGEVGVIESIDTTHYTCIVRTNEGGAGALRYDVPITPVYLAPNGQGIWFLPEIGTRVIVGTIGKGTRNEYSFMIGAAFAIDPGDFDVDTAVITDEGAEEEPAIPDFRNNRPVLQMGDIVLSSSDRNFIVMRKGGIIEVGATQMAKRFYIPLQNVIRDLSQIYEMQNSAGIFQMTRKEADNTWGTVDLEIPASAPEGETATETVTVDKVPTELNLRVREFESDEVPMISIDLGAVTRTAIAEEGLDDDSPGNFAHSNYTNFNESNGLAHLLARLNINNRVKIYIDKDGNYTSTVNGVELHVHNGPRQEEIYKGNYIVDYQNRFNAFYRSVEEEVSTVRRTTIGTSDTTIVGTPEEPETSWTVSSAGADLTTQGAVKIKGSKTTIEAGGLLKLDAGSDISLSCDNLVISTMGTADHMYSGSVTQTILNSDLSGSAYRIINESAGEIQLHNSLGAIRLSCFGRPSSGGQAGIGLPGAGGLAEILVKPNGTVSMSFLAAGVITSSVEINSTGCALTTLGGEISIDQAGFVNLGGTIAGAGNGGVVTTLTHPVCYVTGLPINGSTTVGAASVGFAPGPATPTSFVLDPT
jgi:hypothetical protein